MSHARQRLAAYVAAFALMAATAGPALTQGRVEIVALGASNTEGWGLSPSQAYPARLRALLMAKGIDANVSNAGGVHFTSAGYAILSQRVLPQVLAALSAAEAPRCQRLS